MKKIKLIKNRSDIGAGTRGADMGIDAIEIAAINQGNDYFNHFDYEDVKTHNESIYNKVRNSFAKRIEDVWEQCFRVAISVEKALKNDHFPIVLSGDHSSALGTISGIKNYIQSKTLGVIWIDAHADLHSPYTSPSGNIHGMPLAAALNEDNLECKINTIDKTTEKFWTKLKNISQNPKVLPNHLIYFGLRSYEEAERHCITKNKIRLFEVSEMRHRGSDICLSEALQRLSDCEVIYISVDVDSLDCDMISYGTGTPVSKGFDVEEVKKIVNTFIQSKKVICVEFVEINPLLDKKGNKMAEVAFEIVDSMTKTYLET